MDRAKAKNDRASVEKIQKQIDEMGGREEYQRASQLSTKFHSTSRWVLKVLAQKGWTNGIEIGASNNTGMKGSDNDADKNDREKVADVKATPSTKKKLKKLKRATEILEVGAINTELLNASKRTVRVPMKKTSTAKSNQPYQEHDQKQSYQNIPLHNINVRAIDLRSSHPEIEEMDFLAMPVRNEKSGTYDAIVCSMVLNCVTTPEDRGIMLSLLYKQLVPGGLCFLTIPKLCVNQSKFMNRQLLEEILTEALGFLIDDKRETPKVAFWVLRRPPETIVSSPQNGDHGRSKSDKKVKMKIAPWNPKWGTTKIIHRGQKYRNFFAVSLKKGDVYIRRGYNL